jgi:2-polyprenyl-3-methyl-5-hydroxy-6-metoxy-1,4-benzoquinol methylase
MTFEQQYYEQSSVWQEYSGNKEEDARVRETLDLIPVTVGSILDIGCGIGILTNRLSPVRVVGLDFAHTPLRQVKKNPVQASITHLPFRRGKFELIVITEVFEHLSDPDFQDGIREILRMDPEYILLSTPLNEDISTGLCKCAICGDIFNLFLHQRSFDTLTVQKMFPGYRLEKTVHSSLRVTPNKTLVGLEHRCGFFCYSESALCAKCGGHALRPPLIISTVVGSLDYALNQVKQTLGIKRPYHQILLFRRTR